LEISKKDISKFLIVFPSLQEQTAIANVLSTADKEIDLLNQKLETLKQQKKALMQLLLTGIVRTTGLKTN
jgi:type I restriction enzyme S subunit